MPDDDEEIEGRVAAIFNRVSNLWSYSPKAPIRKSPDATEIPLEFESPLNVLNEKALGDGPGFSTPSPKLRRKKSTELEQEGPQTRSATKATASKDPQEVKQSLRVPNGNSRGSTSIPIRTSPRGKKRSREQEDKDLPTSKSSRKGSGPKGRADPVNELSGRSENPEVRVQDTAGGKIRTPRATRRNAKPKALPQADRIFDVERSPSPARHLTRHQAASSSQKRWRGLPKTRQISPTLDELEAAEDSAAESSAHEAAAPREKKRRKASEGQRKQQESANISQGVSRESTEEDVPHTAFLGAHGAWKRVLKATCENRDDDEEEESSGESGDDDEDMSQDEDQGEDGIFMEDLAHGSAEYATKPIQELSIYVQKAKRLYRTLISSELNNKPGTKTNDKLYEVIGDLELQITNIREFDIDGYGEKIVRRKTGQAIKMIYERSIPDMADLLNNAILYRSSDPPEIYDLRSIQEIMRLFDLILDLCDTAYHWEARPLDLMKSSIRKVRSTVVPALRKLSSVFAKDMQRLLVIERKKRNREKFQTQDMSSMEQEHERAKSDDERRSEEFRRIEEDIKRSQEIFRNERFGRSSLVDENRRFNLTARDSSHHVRNHETLWSRGEEHELLKQLQKRTLRNLPGRLRMT